MKASLFKNPLFRFLITAFAFFIAWFLVYELWLHPKGDLDRWMIDNLSFFTYHVLDIIGYQPITELLEGDMRIIGIDGTHGVWVGDPCNGLTLFALFTGFVMAYPGPVLKKLWFIPAGLLAIHLLNVFRIAGLSLTLYHAPDWLEFNHTYTFTIVVYSFVFFLWIIWANSLSGVRMNKDNEKNVV